MTPLDRFGTVIKAVLVAGIFAGLIVAAAQYVWTEPMIDQAISLEDARHAAEPGQAAGHRQEAPLVDRPTQKKGLFLGYGMYGITWGLLFGIAYFIAQPWIVNRGRVGRALLLAAGSYWAVGLLPFLKYPANPPGVGDPSTLDYRLRLYLALLVLGVCIVMLAFPVRMWAAKRMFTHGATAITVAFVVACSALVYVVLPANPDPILAPMSLVNSFRVHSLAGITLFWLILGPVTGLILVWLRDSSQQLPQIGTQVSRPAPPIER